jgi:Glycosyltransferase family 87
MTQRQHVALATWTGALLCAVFFLATSFRYGWNRDATDFRNYYTGALLVRKSEPLRNFYDAGWFQRQMNEAGIQPLGSYIPQTPLGMLPLIPFSGFPIQTAKRIWLLLNLGFLGATLWMLARLTGLRLPVVALLAFSGYWAIHVNFLFGQYYVCILFLITGSLFCLERRGDRRAGAFLSIALALKLYGGPFLLYLAVKRRWTAMTAMLTGTLCFVGIAAYLFGWSDLLYFWHHILPRAVAGETIDPYSSLNNTFSTLFRRLFVREAELNPHPLWNAPAAFFFLQPFITLLIFLTPLLAIVRSTDLKSTFAWSSLAVVLASPNIGSYTYLLALLPVVLLLEKASPRQRVFLVGSYFLLGLPMNSSWSWFFPKLWILLALFLFAAAPYWRLVRPAVAVVALCSIALLAVISAAFHIASYSQEPEQHFELVAVQEGAIFSSSPAVLPSGIAYQALSRDRYVLHWLHDDRIEEFRFNGHVINPVAEFPKGFVRFDLLANRRSKSVLFDVNTRSLLPAEPSRYIRTAQLALTEQQMASPDKKWIVFTKLTAGNTQIWLKNANNGEARRVTGGDCSSWSPTWELDSSGILFASDCNRGIACPALYRARIKDM